MFTKYVSNQVTNALSNQGIELLKHQVIEYMGNKEYKLVEHLSTN